jgi:multiple sugar transport system ATP-binding protein
MVYVTHDQVEAMTLADRIVVLKAGRIEQVGAPLELYEHPCNQFVAGFIGSPRMNFIEAELVSASPGRAQVRAAGGFELHCDVDASRARPGDRVTLGVRPEHLTAAGGPGPNVLGATVSFIDRLGGNAYVYFDFPGAELSLTAEWRGNPTLRGGDPAWLAADPAQCYLFDAEGLAFPRRAIPQQQAA